MLRKFTIFPLALILLVSLAAVLPQLPMQVDLSSFTINTTAGVMSAKVLEVKSDAMKNGWILNLKVSQDGAECVGIVSLTNPDAPKYIGELAERRVTGSCLDEKVKQGLIDKLAEAVQNAAKSEWKSFEPFWQQIVQKVLGSAAS